MNGGAADLVRWAMILLALLLAGMAVAVVQEARRFRAPGWHIYLVAWSYLDFIAWATLDVYSRMGEPLSWRPLFGIYALVKGLAAILIMIAYYRPSSRHRRHSAAAVVNAERLLREAGVDAELEQRD